jgi:hypothetical protein
LRRHSGESRRKGPLWGIQNLDGSGSGITNTSLLAACGHALFVVKAETAIFDFLCYYHYIYSKITGQQLVFK